MHAKLRIKKIFILAERLLWIFYLLLVTFLFRFMSFSLMDESLFPFTTDSILLLVSNVLIFLGTVFVVSCFVKGKLPFLLVEDFLKIFFLKIFPTALAIRVAADLIMLAIRKMVWTSVWIRFSMEAVVLFAVFQTISRFLSYSSPVKTRTRWVLLAVGVVWTWLCTGYYAYRQYLAQNTDACVVNKYKNWSEFYDLAVHKLEWEQIGLAFSLGLYLILFLCFGLLSISTDDQASEYKPRMFIARQLLFFFMLGMVYLVKGAVLPHGLLTLPYGNERQHSSYSAEAKEGIYDDYMVRRIDRINGYGSTEKVYQNTRVWIKQGNDLLLTFDRVLNRKQGRLYGFSVAGVDSAFRYEFDAVGYVKDKEPFVIRTEDIASYATKDEPLIAVCEELIREGYFEAFEYSYSYLLKYDAEFAECFVSDQEKNHWPMMNSAKNVYLNKDYMTSVIAQLTGYRTDEK